MPSMNFRTWSNLKALARPFSTFERRWQAVAVFGLLVALLLSFNGLSVVSSYVNRNFMNALEERQTDRFWRLALLYVGVFGLLTVCTVFARFVEERLGLLLRDGLTRFLIGRYLADRTYQYLTERQDIDNPDQRITEDVKTFTATSLSFAVIILNSTISLIAFAGVLWSITPWLFATAVLYSLFGTAMTIVLGHRLVGLNFLQLKKEADFRFRLIHVRENGESIALQGSEPQESRRLLDRLQALVDNFRQIIGVNRNVGFFTNGYSYMMQIVPVLVVAPLYLRGDVRIGVVTQSIQSFAFVLNAFSVIVTQFQALTSFAAVIDRLGSLVGAIGGAPERAGPQVAVTEDGPRVAFEGLTLWTPKGDRKLVKELSADVPPGRRLLVLGPNGAGKSALFRAAAGLWPWGEGRVVRPRPGDVIFLPHDPHLAPGTLREQLFEGAGCRELPDERVHEVFREIKFEKVLKRVGGLDAVDDWQNVLSPGEKRLFAFARLLLAGPKYAFIDAGIEGLTDFWIHTLYGALAQTQTTYLSIGDHPALRHYHDEILDLVGEGAWKYETCRVRE